VNTDSLFVRYLKGRRVLIKIVDKQFTVKIVEQFEVIYGNKRGIFYIPFFSCLSSVAMSCITLGLTPMRMVSAHSATSYNRGILKPVYHKINNKWNGRQFLSVINWPHVFQFLVCQVPGSFFCRFRSDSALCTFLNERWFYLTSNYNLLAIFCA
jgi:hypothetical protein